MSDEKNISPLLDGFTLGNPVSEHHGVVCYPAIKENTSKKYIVKMISVPASQAKFDALMLAGAYKDPGDAMEYFRGNGEDILKEAELLKNLSRIEGFLPYEGWQMEPITRRRLGYHVYLVGSYKRSLEKYMGKNAFTHLEAVNLGLDLCSALSICRQSGYLYGDLKPNNIYVSEKKEYRIGDLGFIPLDSLRYASLPERYFSPYTPPELMDPMEPINLTVDTYAVGMILYQLYNDGHLPFNGISPTEPLPSPCHADYEMAELIMKAIDPDPSQRWNDPKELGKAIASYMQRNSVNDIPITPFIPLDVKPEDIVVITPKKASKTEEENAAAEPAPEELPVPEETVFVPEEVTVDSDASAIQEQIPEDPEVPQEKPESYDMKSEPATDSEETELTIATDPETVEEPEVSQVDSESVCEESVNAESSITDISEEVAKILVKADDIISHEIPEESLFPTEEEKPDPFAFAKEDSEVLEDDFPEDPLMEDSDQQGPPEKKKSGKHFEDTTRKKKLRKFFSGCLTLILLCGAGVGGFWYYQNVFLQTIDAISVDGTQDQITVLVDTKIAESQLAVHCTDGNGKQYSESVQGGKATFSNLKASTEYTISLDMKGFHKLIGETSAVFTTDATTQVLSFQTIAGNDDGSVLLNYTVDGDDPDFWNIRYFAEGEEEKVETVTGHSAMITGLSVGKLYTFTLDGGKNFDLGGETSVQYLASRLILAENLNVTSSNAGDITVSWKTPGDVVVESWNVRCYDGFGFEEQVTVTENKVLFTGIDSGSHYTVEVTAAGMTQPASIYISADPIHLSEFQVDETKETEMKIVWKYTGPDPEGGWLLTYTVDGSGKQEIPCEKASATISPLIPGGNYAFVLETADGKTVFNNMVNHQAMEAEPFKEQAYVAENVSIHLLKTPEEADWSYETIQEDAFTNTFAVGESASMVLKSSSAVYLPSNKTRVLFVFRDSYGNILPELVTEVTHTWKNIWFGGDSKIGELDIPTLPSVAGDYLMELYFNGGSVAKLNLTMVE